MKRRGHISPRIETSRNFELAFDGYSDGKHSRSTVRKFEKDLSEHLARLLDAYQKETWHTSPYRDEVIHERKTRVISKLPIEDHVMQWGACLHVEPLLCDTFIRRSCSCVKSRGTHDFVNLMRKDMQDYRGTYYFVQLDAHHYFLHIKHDLIEERLRTKIKDPKLLRFLDEFIESYYQGLPLGVKISQILANFFLAVFDRDTIDCFGIRNDPDKLSYWRSRYVTDCLMTCRTEEQAAEVSKGAIYLAGKFDRFVNEGVLHYSRFADNIIIQHEDKTFLHLITELAIMTLARDYYIDVNGDWNVRPVHNGGIDVCGYVSFHDHRRLRKRNKVELCREVSKFRKKGFTPEEIRIQCSSRIGFAVHGDCRNLLKKLDINMGKRLGNVIKNNKVQIPFKGMKFEQKRAFKDIVCKIDQSEEDYNILLLDYSIEDSKVEKEDLIIQVPDGNGGTKPEKVTRPKKCLVIRYKRIQETITTIQPDGEENETYICEKVMDQDGNPTSRDAEYYAYTGSEVMMDQANQDFKKEDLPCPTVIKEELNKQGKKYYKFT